jgi:hypothetical protein
LTDAFGRTDWSLRESLSCQASNRCELISQSKATLPYTPPLFQFIDATFEKAKPNVRINGKKFEDLKDEDDGAFHWHLRLAVYIL